MQAAPKCKIQNFFELRTNGWGCHDAAHFPKPVLYLSPKSATLPSLPTLLAAWVCFQRRVRSFKNAWGGIIWISIIKLTLGAMYRHFGCRLSLNKMGELESCTVKFFVNCLATPFCGSLSRNFVFYDFLSKTAFLRGRSPVVLERLSHWLTVFLSELQIFSYRSLFMFYRHLHMLKDFEAS